ncbi:PREDICTED: uncharacterized protein LOC109129300 [Camelina sativa]|uniref:Uncharacterized protein LOC109129300 n=1 Tax=Camelina sativa TaxID=90675 RepID=A0ABM1R0Z6_CAMSA|nr:PREDICTED: uncharacterized protein LOC109129300 [Camelina sativa]
MEIMPRGFVVVVEVSPTFFFSRSKFMFCLVV